MQNPWEHPKFDPGGHSDRLDSRDYDWREVGAALPPFDWNKGYDVEAELAGVLKMPGFSLPVKNQDGSLSCGGQAWGNQSGVLEAFATGSFEERSAKYIYSQTYVPGGGSRGRDNCKILIKQGCARESVLSSYENGNPPSETFMQRSEDISVGVRSDAKNSRALAYANVPCDIDMVAQAMAANHGAIILVQGSNNGTWGSAIPQPPQNGDNIWRHWIYCGKAMLVDGVKMIKVLNSWGTGAGENGWQWISEKYFRTTLFTNGAAVESCWTHVVNTAAAVGAFAYSFDRDLKQTDTGLDVISLQQALQSLGFFPANLSPTGYYGTTTAQSLLKFQLKNQVAPVNQLILLGGRNCGPATRSALNKLFS